MSKLNKAMVSSTIVLATAGGLVYFFLVPAFAGQVPIPSEIRLGAYALRFYSLAVLAGILAAFFVARKFTSRFAVPEGDLENLFLLSILFGLVGARMHHVLSAWSVYAAYPAMIWQFWRGGLGFFGGILGAISAVAIYSRVKKLDFWKVCDLLAVVAPLGQAIGRLGNFFNQEAYGLPTSLPWKMFIDFGHRLPVYWSNDFFHPVFLYESLLDLGIFCLMLHLARKKSSRPGLLLACYLILYSLVRYFLEPFRADANLFYGFYSNQLLGLIFLLVGLGIYIASFARKWNTRSSS
ncbi:MAG: prolipoprotein diacylglyceryl transferase [Patescibacteria group bacterium]|nr:prolipoprotein diacylglyceryl transferase [Patescibacteria group bacterium]